MLTACLGNYRDHISKSKNGIGDVGQWHSALGDILRAMKEMEGEEADTATI